MPLATEEDDPLVTAPPVTSDAGSSPLVPSSPADAEIPPQPNDIQKPEPAPPQPPVPGVPPAPPQFRRKTALERVKDFETATDRYQATEADKQTRYGKALDRFNANQMFETQQATRKTLNAEARQTLGDSHVQVATDPDTGTVGPVRDESGNIEFRPGKGPIRYDSAGNAIQTQYETTGPKVVALDKNADIGIHPDRPNELYRQNKHAPWEYLGTVQDGLKSKDPAIQKSATDAQLGIDKRLHSEVAHDLGEEVASRALAVQNKVKDFQGKAETLRKLNAQFDSFDKDHPGINETEGGFLGMGARPSQTAQTLREQKSGIQKQIEDLQSKGYSTVTDAKVVREFAKPEMDALHAAREETTSWLAPKEPGDFDRLIQNRVASLAEQGVDASTDPVLVSLEKKKSALGIGQTPGDKAPGMISPGNIDLNNRPVVNNEDGSVSTVRSISANIDGKEVLIPTVAADGSKVLSDEDAIAQYKATGKHLGIFASPEAANAYAEKVHQDQAVKVDPILGPIVAERDKLQTDRQQAQDQLGQMQADYQSRLQPFRDQLQQSETQIFPLQNQADKLESRLASIVKMPEPIEGEDPEVRRREMMLRVSQLSDPKDRVRAQTILNSLNPLSTEIASRRAQMQPVIDAHDQLAAEGEQKLSEHQRQLEAGFAQRETDLQGKVEGAQAIQAVQESQNALSLISSTLLEPTSPAFAKEVAAAKDEAQQKRIAEYSKNGGGLMAGLPGSSNLDKGIISGIAKMVGGSIKGASQFLEAVSDRITIHDPQIPNNYKNEGARKLADLFLKVPGIVGGDENALSYKAGSLGGQVVATVGEAVVSPYLLVAQFFGQGYNGQADAAEQYFEQKARENPNAPRDLAQEKIATERAGVLGGAVNAIFAIPFNRFGKVVSSIFKSTKANTIANVLKTSYEKGGIGAVAQDLKILQASIEKTAGQDAFKKVASESLEQVIKEITKTPLRHVGNVLAETATGAGIWGGIQTAQNLVTKTYNPKTGLFENVPEQMAQGAILSAFFGGIGQSVKARVAGEARDQLRSATAKQAWNPQTGFQGREPGSPGGGAPEPGAPPGLGGGPGPEPGSAPSPQAAHTEINALVPSERVKPEQVEITQHALRGLVKLAQGNPMEALTSVEQAALESKTPDGMSRVEMVNGKPVINDATLQRVREIAPVTAQLLPRSEEQQRQTALAGGENGKGESKGAPVSPTGEQPTFSVDVQDGAGNTTTREVQAPNEEAARSQVGATIAPGQGLIRDVTQITAPTSGEATAYVAPEHFESHVLEQITKEAGRPLAEKEAGAVRNLIKVAAPAYERWSKAFQTVNATLQSRSSAGVSFSPQTKALNIMIPDLARHVSLYENPKSGEALVRHEAAHAVTMASGAKVVQLFKLAPQALQRAMKQTYRAPGATDYNFAHELWAYALAGKVELAAGRKIKLSGKFLPEQANRDFIVKYKRAFAEVLKFTRDIEGYLRKGGVEESVISQWKELEALFVSKIKAVDAGAEKASDKESPDDKLPSNSPGRGSGSRAPPASTRTPEPVRSEPAVANSGGAQGAGSNRGGPAGSKESVARAPETKPGAKLDAELPVAEKETTGSADSGDLATGDLALRQQERTALADKLKIPLTAVGHSSKVTSNGRTVNVAYVAQEAADARPSHDPQGRATQGYNQALQPRDRGLPAYRKQAQNIAGNLQFAQASFFPETKVPATTPEVGAPIMTGDGDTLIGNGREIGIKLAYEQGKGGNYKTDFIRNARAFGIDPATVRDMKQPILKRVILDDLPKEDLVRFSQESNESPAMGSNAIEVAGRDATRLTPELLSLFDPNYALDSAKNQGFLRAYLRDVVKGGGAANEANLTGSELERRVRAAVFAYAYGTDATGRAALERLAGDESDPGGKTITNALLTVAPIVARMKTDIATGDLFPLDISAAISRAAQDISEALRNKPVKQSTATALADMRNQAGLLEADPLEKAVVNFFLDHRLSRQSIELGLSNYVEAVFKLGNPKNAELFGERTAPQPLDLFNRATSPQALAGDLNAQVIANVDTGERIEGPVLVNEKGEVIARGTIGQTHKQLADSIIKNPDTPAGLLDDAIEAGSNDALHVFVDNKGNILSREDAAPVAVSAGQAPAGTTKLQSQDLSSVPKLKPGQEQGELPTGPTKTVEQLATEQRTREQDLLKLQQQQDVRLGASRALIAGDYVRPEADMFTTANQGELFSQPVADVSMQQPLGGYAGKTPLTQPEVASGAIAQLSRREINTAAAELPERMRTAVTGILSGDSLSVIGESNGTSPQAVGRLAKEAVRRVRSKLGEKAIRPDASNFTLEGRQPKDYSRSSTQVTLSKAEAAPFKEFAKQLPESEIYVDPDDPTFGREKQPHVTALYGITQANPDLTAQVLLAESGGRIQATVGKLSVFHTPKYDVLKADIESADLHAVNKALRKQVPFESDFPDYKPHLTIAYLKKGEGTKYVGDARFEGQPLTFSTIDFRSKDGRKFEIDLSHGSGSPVGDQLQILDNAISMELRAQETNDPLKELMAMIDTDVLGDLYRKASGEVSGKFETGRPDLALGAEGASVRAAHQFHTDTFEAQTIEGWDKEADRHLADPKWSREFSDAIVRRYLSGENLLAWETRAAMRLIAADSHSLGTPAEKLEHAVRSFAYARLRSKAGQELASGADPFKTPEERGREFLSKTFFRLKPEVEAQIEAEPNKQKRQEKLDVAMTERITQLEKAFSYLAGKGITIDDIFNGSWELHGKGKELIKSEMGRFDVRQQQALKLAQTGTRSAADIAKATGLPIAEVERINDQFIDQLEKSLTEKVANGLTLENIDLQGALLAQAPEPPAPSNAAGKTPEEIKAEVRRIIKGMGFVASKDLGKFKVAKKKRPKLFVPPKPYSGPVPTSEPVPFEKRDQSTLPITVPPKQYTGPRPTDAPVPVESRRQEPLLPSEPVRLPNENAPVPYPEGQPAPYTGRVLGQIGLPLYQEMMIRKGTDMGSMDDLIKIGRVAQSLDAKPFDMVYEAWINNIYSGLATHIANISGNTLSTVMDFTLQRGMEALLNTIYRDSGSPTFGEFKYIAKGILPGMTAGIRRGARAWDTESSVFSRDVLNEQIEILEALDKAGGVPPAIPGKTGRVIRIPVRALLFEDEVFKSIIGQMEVGAQAYRIAKYEEGLTGDKMSDRMNELISTPGSKAWSRAVEKAIYLTYQEPTGLTTLFRDQGKSAALGKMALKARAEGRMRTAQVLRTEELVVRNLYRAAGIFFPVIRTTYNIFKIGVSTVNVAPTFTTIPYRFAKAGFYRWYKGKPFVESYSKARQIHDIAQQLIAWVTFATLWSLTAGDEDDDDKKILLTGSMPYSQTKRGMRELNDRAYGGTYMLRLGGRNGIYIPYGRVEPIATVLGTVVDTITNIKKIKHGQGLAETGDALLGYFVAQAQAKTFLGGFRDLTEAFDSGNYSDVPKKLLMQAFVPNLIRQPLRAIDDWVRESKTAPALYQTVPAGPMAQRKINPLGRPVEKGGNAFTRLFVAAGIKPDAQLEKVDRLLLNWNREHPTETWAPGTPLNTYHDSAGKTAKMTGPEYAKFLEVSGKRAADKLRAEITEAQVNRPSPEDKKRIEQIFEDAHRQTKEEMFPKRRVNQVRVAFPKAA